MTRASSKPPVYETQSTSGEANGSEPALLAEQTNLALGAAQAAAQDGHTASQHRNRHSHHLPHPHVSDVLNVPERDIEDVPPPPYQSADYGQFEINQQGLDTGARVGRDGRVEIKIREKSRKLAKLLAPSIGLQFGAQEPEIPPGLGWDEGVPPPPMNIVIQIVGSRGDVQPFVALGQVLKAKFNHRVRIATHPTFKQFVLENGLEFFSIGGDPAELMAFMVKNPGLMPGMDSLRNGDIGKRRKGIYEIVLGCWRSTIEAGDGSGAAASTDAIDGLSVSSGMSIGDPTMKPFVADAIIANPPSFGHIHIAEKLGIPLHLMFTMPWSPTQSFPHPLANIISSNTDPNFANFLSYAMVDMMTWQGLGDIINRFREKTLSLDPVSIIWAPGMLSRLRIPWTYCWSPALIPKPKDWSSHIDISGFYFLNLASNYQPPADLAEFLEAGPPPVYIGFGSIVVDDPNAMTEMIFEAVKKTGQRALVSKGWGGLGADEFVIPEGVFMLGNCPHDWLFQKVSCVVHHGGAGTTAAGIASGCPTVVVPFFGDQPFWGSMTARAGAGPPPIAYKDLTADKLAESILEALKPESKERAQELCEKIKQEKGADAGADSFHKHLNVAHLRCVLDPSRVAVWRVKRTDIRLSALAATVLGNEGLLDFTDLKLYRPREYAVEEGPPGPLIGGAAALIGTASEIGVGIADMPVEILRTLKSASSDRSNARKEEKKAASEAELSRQASEVSEASGALSSPETLSIRSEDTVRSPSLPATRTGSVIFSEPEGSRSSPRDLPSIELQPTRSDPGNSGAASTTNPSETDLRSRTTTNSTLSPGSPGPKGTLSYSTSRGSSKSRNPSIATTSANVASDVSGVTLDSAITAAKATSKIVGAGLKSPMDFTMSLAQGFHNAPKLYGDTTVRKAYKITDFQSGLKAASKEFGYGLYDGITGVVSQPIKGAAEEGAAGFFKGLVKGSFGLVIKPSAAMWGLPGYTFKGIYMELNKQFGTSSENYIIAARTAQGYEDWKLSTPRDREKIIAGWNSQHITLKRVKMKHGKDKQEDGDDSNSLTPSDSRNSGELASGFKHTRHMSWDERKELDKRKKAFKKEEKKRAKERKKLEKKGKKERKHSGDSSIVSDVKLHAEPSPHEVTDLATADEAEFEAAIRRSVIETSRGDPEQDEMIERALRASVTALRDELNNPSGEENQAYDRAIEASVREAQRAQTQQTEKGVARTIRTESLPSGDEEDVELARALKNSLEDSRRQDREDHWEHHSDSGSDTEDDEDFKRVLEESKSSHVAKRTELQKKRDTQRFLTPPESPIADHLTDPIVERSKMEEKQLRQAILASQEANGQVHHLGHTEDEDDEELRRALAESTMESERQAAILEKSRTEEDIVLEYVKKQSQLEEQHRRARAGPSVAN